MYEETTPPRTDRPALRLPFPVDETTDEEVPQQAAICADNQESTPLLEMSETSLIAGMYEETTPPRTERPALRLPFSADEITDEEVPQQAAICADNQESTPLLFNIDGSEMSAETASMAGPYQETTTPWTERPSLLLPYPAEDEGFRQCTTEMCQNNTESRRINHPLNEQEPLRFVCETAVPGPGKQEKTLLQFTTHRPPETASRPERPRACLPYPRDDEGFQQPTTGINQNTTRAHEITHHLNELQARTAARLFRVERETPTSGPGPTQLTTSRMAAQTAARGITHRVTSQPDIRRFLDRPPDYIELFPEHAADIDRAWDSRTSLVLNEEMPARVGDTTPAPGQNADERRMIAKCASCLITAGIVAIVIWIGIALPGGLSTTQDNTITTQDSTSRIRDSPITRVRLAGTGATSSKGRVEVYKYGSWGTVCDDFWDIKDGNVVCRQLGFSRATRVETKPSIFGRGSGDIFMDNVACTGWESHIWDCPHLTEETENCDHSEDAGVYCV